MIVWFLRGPPGWHLPSKMLRQINAIFGVLDFGFGPLRALGGFGYLGLGVAKKLCDL